MCWSGTASAGDLWATVEGKDTVDCADKLRKDAGWGEYEGGEE